MPFTLIKGEFVPGAGRPDGDSIRFRPDNPDLVFRLRQRGRPPKINQNNGTIQLRFEGIDTMESRALSDFADPATENNLTLCGFPPGGTETTAPGYVLSNQLGPNGRPIAFVFSGESDREDGDSVFLEVDEMSTSVNYAQLLAGHAYPLYYDTLFAELRDSLTAAVDEAAGDDRGVWEQDTTRSGVTWGGDPSLATMPPIFPKLWRRLDKYSGNRDVEDSTKLDEFLEFLAFANDERVLVLSEQRYTGFDNIVEVDGNRVSMKIDTTDMVITSRSNIPA